MGFDEVPGVLTFLGVVVIFVAVNITQRGSKMRKEKEEGQVEMQKIGKE